MNPFDWQTPAALAVLVTALLFLRRHLKARRQPKGCTHCSAAAPAKFR